LLNSLGIREDARAEQLNVQDFVRLFEAISSTKPAAGPDSRS
jgi:16S rRNA A1518/A1519 N6-dimethyltransferase RsmA/KsgA/DIM1 with predicted DNA glycosylase/AP lyase activity